MQKVVEPFGYVGIHGGSYQHLLASTQKGTLPMLNFEFSTLFLPYSELLLKPLRNRCLIDMQEQIALLIHYHLCRNIIGKGIPSLLIGVKPATIVDSMPYRESVLDW